jgi:nitroimidazol reductase NimA-like FMN-containing flavoprotein (pyridoxamine 5'-phosphate oxidase superfamily)
VTVPRSVRPKFPKGYVDHPVGMVPWSEVEGRLAGAKNYWLCTVRPDGSPHAVPKWGVWVDGRIYFDGSPETRHARNIAANPRVVLHLESGDAATMVEGTVRAMARPSAAEARSVSAAYGAKYRREGYAPKPDQWDEGGLFVLTPRRVLAWTEFTKDPTKFVFG